MCVRVPNIESGRLMIIKSQLRRFATGIPAAEAHQLRGMNSHRVVGCRSCAARGSSTVNRRLEGSAGIAEAAARLGVQVNFAGWFSYTPRLTMHTWAVAEIRVPFFWKLFQGIQGLLCQQQRVDSPSCCMPLNSYLHV